MASILHSINVASERISKTSSSARIDTEVLMCFVLQCNTAHLAAWPEKELSTAQITLFESLVNKRSSGEPIAYLTGEKEFWSLNLNVTQDTLIPRPETELLVETILQHFQQKTTLNIVDLGTGSGAIAIALAHEKPNWSVTATDISEKALAVSEANAERHQLDNIQFIHSNWYESLKDQTFDVIISNPPYIAKNDIHLSQGDLRFEPQGALSSGDTGMDDINKIVKLAPNHLKPNAWLFLEHGYDQKKNVYQCLNNVGFSNIQQMDDLSKNPRLTFAQHQSA